MHFTQEQLLNSLSSQQIAYTLYQHEPVFTCKQAEDLAALNMPGIGIKNLFLTCKKKFYLITAAHDTHIDLKTIGKDIAAKDLHFTNATLLMDYLGVEPGSVTPLAIINDTTESVQIIIDAAILNQEYIQIHPLKNDATVVITPSDLIKFFDSINRSYRIYDFAQ